MNPRRGLVFQGFLIGSSRSARLALPLVHGAPAPMESASTTPSFRRAFVYDRNPCELKFSVIQKSYAKETGQEAQSWPSPYGT